MRTTVDIDSHLLKRLRAEAHRKGMPFKELLSGVIRRGLEEVTAATRYRCPTYAMGIPSAFQDLDKALGIAAQLEDEEIARELTLRK